ncbi:MAG: T9SS type A sorting domain-containing protein [Flavobacteriales bacterium]|nr:T9SS type A sorting domain-containing protein [Flavobacteriales bacterium]
MQGATIDESNSASFGTISSYNNAGNYEFQTICKIEGNDVYFSHELVNSYDVSSSVQLIRVPVYEDAIISGSDLTATTWNGTIGGVVVLEVEGTLDFGSQNIDVEGSGFRGGDAELSGGGCSGVVLDATYYTPFSDPDAKALKGEGIAAVIAGKECGRGPQANGGGGGNNHNGGGSGGGNYGAGGAGGRRVKASFFACGSFEGIESKELSTAYTDGKIFMGGGGGAGHGNNSGEVSENGANGGGIVIIKADRILGNGQNINADGAAHAVNAANEGGGGGGGGGTVLLEVNSYGSPLSVSVDGGNGTDVDNMGSSNCNGPGGGGGGGLVWSSGAGIPTELSSSFNGGTAGVIASTSQPGCSPGSSNDGTDGSNGAHLSNLILTSGTTILATGSTEEIACGSYTLPSGSQTYTTSGIYADTLSTVDGCDSVLTIDLTINTVDTSVIVNIGSLTANASPAAYQWIDCQDFSIISGATDQTFAPTSSGNYALVVTENGCTDTSACYHLTPLSIEKNEFESSILLYPNPVTNGTFILQLKDTYQEVSITIRNPEGKLISQTKAKYTANVPVSINQPKGLYFITVQADEKVAVLKLLVD